MRGTTLFHAMARPLAVAAASALLVGCSASPSQSGEPPGDSPSNPGATGGASAAIDAGASLGTVTPAGTGGGGRDATATQEGANTNDGGATSSYGAAVAGLAGLDLWLPLDESSGTLALDHSAHRWNGTYPTSGVKYRVVNPKAGPGVDAAAVTLSASAAVSVPNHPALDLSTSVSARWTILMWAQVLTTAAGTYPPLLLMGSQRTTGWGVLYSNEYQSVIFGSGNVQSAVPGPVLTDTMHLIGVTFDGSTVDFYVDGAYQGSDSGAAGVTVGNTTSPLLLGPNLTVGQLIITSSALSAAQHSAIFDAYTAASGKPPPAMDASIDASPTSPANEDAGSDAGAGVVDASSGFVAKAPSGPATPSGGWHVDFADDFNIPLGTGAGEDNFWYPSQSWNGNPGSDVAGNNSYETEVYNSSQVSVSGGVLRLTAVYDYDRAPASNGNTQANYVSGMVTSPVGSSGYQGFTWTPGDGSTWAFEIVCQWPVNTGELFNAWWSSTQAGWSDERDFFEGHTSQAGIDTDWIYDTSPVTQDYYETTLAFDPSAAMHRYTYVVYGDQSWSTFIDGALQTWVGNSGVSPVESSDDAPMELIVNYALSATTFTSGSRTFVVDSVAVYQDGDHAGQSIAGGGIAPGTVLGG
jgi:Concanavalin A-like lectin/glucanases superfamily